MELELQTRSDDLFQWFIGPYRKKVDTWAQEGCSLLTRDNGTDLLRGG